MIDSYRPQVGDLVTFNGWTKEQVNWGNNDIPYMLILGRQYIIDKVETYTWHTKVKIKGVIGKFNSVHFTLADKYSKELENYEHSDLCD